MRTVVRCKDRQEWLEKRKSFWGRPLYNASDMAAYCGDNPYRSAYDAWLEKTGKAQPQDLSDNANIQRGVIREAFIRQTFVESNEAWFKTDYRPFDIYVYKDDEIAIGATLDLEVEVTSDDNPYGLKKGMKGVAEFKSPLATPQTMAAWRDNPPVHYMEQQYAQLMATGWDFDILAAEFFHEGVEGREATYEYRQYKPIVVDAARLWEDADVKELRRRLLEFDSCVKEGRMPDKNIQGMGELQVVFKADVALMDKDFYANFDEVKQALALRVQSFKGLEVSEDNEKEGKAARVELNRIRTSIEDKRKEVVRKWDEPKNLFNQRCKELLEDVDRAVDELDAQLKAIEASRIEAKRRDIDIIIQNAMGAAFEGMDAMLSFFDNCGGIAYDPKWENRGSSLPSIKKAVEAQIEKFKKDFDLLAGFRDDEEVYNAMLMAYAQRRDVSDAMAARTRLLDTREIAAKARQERAVEKAVQKPVSIQETPVKEPTDAIINTDTLPNREQLYTLGFEVRHVTRANIAALNDFLKANGIAFKKTYSTREEE